MLELSEEYRLGRDGLSVSTVAVNPGPSPCPFGIGFHPYLTLGGPVDDLRLVIPAARQLLTDVNGLPTGEGPVFGTAHDFTSGRTVGQARLDTAYTGFFRESDGKVEIKLDHVGQDRGLTLWTDPAFGYLMIFTGDTVEPTRRRRNSLAIEPMTCPPDAFRSGTGLIRLDPGASWSGTWGITPR